QKVLRYMQNTIEARILFYNKSYLYELQHHNFNNYDQIVCGHIDKRLLYLCNQTDNYFYIPGHDANYMAGENIKYQMLKWKNKQDIIKYIFKFKSSPITRHLIENNQIYRDILYNSLKQTIPEDSDLISNFNRWNGEQRLRRYILRSSIMSLSDKQRILIPYFDYKLMDFFINLPLSSLLNQKLYQNAQIRYLYKGNPDLIKIKRGGVKTVRIISNNYFTEYYPKLMNEIKRILKIPKPQKLIWDPTIDWQKDILPKLNLPSCLDLRGLNNSRYINIQYLMTISEVVTALD
ncbi:MAG: hypothetical protein ACP5FZ_04105, partial [Fidelibacterota bacterium]